jgi:hypothetical protein
MQVWCHRYYLRNLCDEERFPDWPIVDHVPFLQVRIIGVSSCRMLFTPVGQARLWTAC